MEEQQAAVGAGELCEVGQAGEGVAIVGLLPSRWLSLYGGTGCCF